MSILCGIPLAGCLSSLACTSWIWKLIRTANHDSENWGFATTEEFEPIPRLCRYILAVYENDLNNPIWEPQGGYGINPEFATKRTYKETHKHAPPYIIYIDHDHEDIVLAFRGLNMAKESDYAVLLDNKLGKKIFDGGYVHHGLFMSAVWVLEKERELLREKLGNHPSYTMTFAGHSLGSGVATILTMLAVENLDQLGNIDRRRVRGFAVAPARSVSLNLAVRYADVLNSVVLQDDVLPRTATPLEDIFKSLFWDTCIPEERFLKDPRRLYAPGRFYHIVERKPIRCGRLPPVVKTSVPVDGRFEHIVPSCNATSDHSIISIEREARMALELMREKEDTAATPKMQRRESLDREHRDALHRAVSLSVPHAYSPSPYRAFDEHEDERPHSDHLSQETSPMTSTIRSKRRNWSEVVAYFYDKDQFGHLNPKRVHSKN